MQNCTEEESRIVKKIEGFDKRMEKYTCKVYLWVGDVVGFVHLRQ